jgi:hypothetical protein
VEGSGMGFWKGGIPGFPLSLPFHHSLTSIIFQLSVTVRGPEVFQCH